MRSETWKYLTNWQNGCPWCGHLLDSHSDTYSYVCSSCNMRWTPKVLEEVKTGFAEGFSFKLIRSELGCVEPICELQKLTVAQLRIMVAQDKEERDETSTPPTLAEAIMAVATELRLGRKQQEEQFTRLAPKIESLAKDINLIQRHGSR